MSSYSSRYDDHRDRRSHGSSRRDSSPRRERRHSPPGPSRRSPSPRNDEKLPQQFGRIETLDPQDDYTVIQKMKNGFRTSPLGSLAKCIDESRKIKVWTRNFKEVRGICTGYVLVFDKHWNLVMKDVDEVHLKPRRAKTPFLDDVKADSLPELAPKVPRKKKDKSAAAETTAAKASETTPTLVDLTDEKESPEGETPAAETAAAAPSEKKKKKKRVRNKGPTTERRKIDKIFIRGDNIVMIAVLPEEEEEEDE